MDLELVTIKESVKELPDKKAHLSNIINGSLITDAEMIFIAVGLKFVKIKCAKILEEY